MPEQEHSRTPPFVYPSEPHVDRHGPCGYSEHRKYFNWLRDDFGFRCVYCLRRETWGSLHGDWQIDHFVPRKIYPDGRLEYTNLVLACSTCNHSKATQFVPNPRATAYGDCVTVDEHGHIAHNNEAGLDLIETLGLDGADYNYMRELILGLERDLSEGSSSFHRLFGFPYTLPDLNQEPPPPAGNTKSQGIAESYFARMERGELPAFF